MPTNKIFWTVFLICAFGFSSVFSSVATAHRVNVFAWVEGDTVYTTSKFSGGKMAQSAEIKVFDDTDKLLLTGKTNNQGEFSFKVPKKCDLKIVLEAGMGHKGEWTLRADEIESIADENLSEEVKTVEALKTVISASESPKAAPEPLSNLMNNPINNLAKKEIQDILENSLDKKLKPVLRMLSESQDNKPKLNDIIGGIGYILGLVGIAAYIHSRKSTPKK